MVYFTASRMTRDGDVNGLHFAEDLNRFLSSPPLMITTVSREIRRSGFMMHEEQHVLNPHIILFVLNLLC